MPGGLAALAIGFCDDARWLTGSEAGQRRCSACQGRRPAGDFAAGVTSLRIHRFAAYFKSWCYSPAQSRFLSSRNFTPRSLICDAADSPPCRRLRQLSPFTVSCACHEMMARLVRHFMLRDAHHVACRSTIIFSISRRLR